MDKGTEVYVDQPQVGSCMGVFTVCQQVVCDSVCGMRGSVQYVDIDVNIDCCLIYNVGKKTRLWVFSRPISLSSVRIYTVSQKSSHF